MLGNRGNPLLLVGFILTFGLALFPVNQSLTEETADERCIRCHVGLYNDKLEQTHLHAPFFERRCTTCHLAAASDWSGAGTAGAETAITGTRVSQDIVWGKISRFTEEGRSLDHLAALDGLERGADYRFRIVQGNQPEQADFTSPWYGLRPAELSGAERISVSEGLSGSGATALTVTPAGDAAAVISWQTAEPLHGWVELQRLDGDLTTASNEATDSDSGHPPLRDAADLAIEACYECHPRSTLGTSHPVRLYGGRDVRIPDELPTVDGMLTCVTCHDPHATAGQMLVREVIKTKLCVTCHTQFKNSSPSTMFD